jgi:hypothetical protein
MRPTTTLIAAIVVLTTVLVIDIWGQGSGRTTGSAPSGPFQISAAASGAGSTCAYVIDTRNGRVWFIRDSEPAKLIGDTSAADAPPAPPRN